MPNQRYYNTVKFMLKPKMRFFFMIPFLFPYIF